MRYYFEDERPKPPNWPLLITLTAIVLLMAAYVYANQIEKLINHFLNR